MLADNEIFGSYSVDDVDAAHRFYAETLGLDARTGEMPGLELRLAGGVNYFLYSKGDQHEPASHTVLNFIVEDVEKTVDALTERGVEFQHLEGEGGVSTDEKGIMRGHGPTIAWFTDPAGNTLSIITPT